MGFALAWKGRLDDRVDLSFGTVTFLYNPDTPVTAPCRVPRPALLREPHRHVDGIRQCRAAGFKVPRADLRESARELAVARLRDHGDDRGAFGLAEIGPAEPNEQGVDVALGDSAIA